jgi:hypothetical protein
MGRKVCSGTLIRGEGKKEDGTPRLNAEGSIRPPTPIFNKELKPSALLFDRADERAGPRGASKGSQMGPNPRPAQGYPP